MSVSVSPVNSAAVAQAAQDPWRSSLPVPMSHYRPADTFVPQEGTLERIIRQENPGVDFHIPKEGIPNEKLPVPMSIVEKARQNKEASVPPAKPPVKPSSGTASVAADAGKKAAKEAAKSGGKWGWILGGVAALAGAAGGYKMYSDKQQEQKLNLSA